VRAGRAEGPPGTFTAEEVRCIEHPGHEQCSWQGRFRVDGEAPRPGYELYGAGRGDLRPGQSVPALDVGRSGRVYPPTGSREWILTGALTALGLVLLAAGARHLLATRSRPPAHPAGGVASEGRAEREVVGQGGG
jgi:hypothetical protein